MIAARLKALQALEMRKGGFTYQAIADKLGYKTAQGPFKAVNDLLIRAERESATEMLELEVQRLDTMLNGIWIKAAKGDHASIDRVVRIGEVRAKLLGLNAPQEMVVRAVQDGFDEILRVAKQTLPQEQFAALAAALRSGVPPELGAGGSEAEEEAEPSS